MWSDHLWLRATLIISDNTDCLVGPLISRQVVHWWGGPLVAWHTSWADYSDKYMTNITVILYKTLSNLNQSFSWKNERTNESANPQCCSCTMLCVYYIYAFMQSCIGAQSCGKTNTTLWVSLDIVVWLAFFQALKGLADFLIASWTQVIWTSAFVAVVKYPYRYFHVLLLLLRLCDSPSLTQWHDVHSTIDCAFHKYCGKGWSGVGYSVWNPFHGPGMSHNKHPWFMHA